MSSTEQSSFSTICILTVEMISSFLVEILSTIGGLVLLVVLDADVDDTRGFGGGGVVALAARIAGDEVALSSEEDAVSDGCVEITVNESS